MDQPDRADDLEAQLRSTLADGRLSRSERRALGESLDRHAHDDGSRSHCLSLAFRLAEEARGRIGDAATFDWLRAVSKLVANAGREPTRSRIAEVLFEPRDEVPPRLISMIEGCRQSLELCVFTITDNRLSGPIRSAHRRGVHVRVISDDLKARDRGSDIWRMAHEGLAVRVDPYPDHMHHKFGIFDRRVAVTGSYNWTRGAAERNLENVLVTDDPRLVTPFREEFERLWEQFEPVR